jgi:hypothetical protein
MIRGVSWTFPITCIRRYGSEVPRGLQRESLLIEIIINVFNDGKFVIGWVSVKSSIA